MKNRFWYFLAIPLIVCSEDTNSQWQPVPTGFPYPNHLILAVNVVNENVIWAATDTMAYASFSSRIMRTTNAGLTWTTHSFPASVWEFILDLDAIDASTAWIATNNFGGGGGIYKTIDGGASWALQRSAASVYIHFFDALNGVSVNRVFVETTTNGGATWNAVSGIPPYFPNEYNIVTAGNNSRATWGDTIWIPTSQGRIYRSSNRGYDWTVRQTSLGRNACITSVAFRDGRNGLAVSSLDSNINYSTNLIARTSDGGVTWNNLSPLPAAPTANCLAYVPGTWGTFVLVGGGYDGDIPGSSYTTNNGETWTTLDARIYNAVEFVSPRIGWVGGITGPTNGGMFKWTGDLFVSVPNEAGQPTEFALFQNYPNPFNPVTTIRYQLPVESRVTLRIFNILGQEVRTLVDDLQPAGHKSIEWDSRNNEAKSVGTGVYSCRLDASSADGQGRSFTQIRKMLILR